MKTIDDHVLESLPTELRIVYDFLDEQTGTAQHQKEETNETQLGTSGII